MRVSLQEKIFKKPAVRENERGVECCCVLSYYSSACFGSLVFISSGIFAVS